MKKFFSICKDSDCIKLNIFGIKISHNLNKEKGKNNFIYVIEPSGKKRKVKGIHGLKIEFHNSNSSVTVHKPFINFKNSKIVLSENCHAVIKGKTEESLNGLKCVSIEMHNNAKIFIGKNFYNAQSYYLIVNNSLEIGDDCMFSGLKILCGDGHKIIDMDNNTVISDTYHNTVIGNHVWIGWDSKILKMHKYLMAQLLGHQVLSQENLMSKML